MGTYLKAMVIELNDLGDSQIILEKNCTRSSLNKVVDELENNYQDLKYFKTVVEMPRMRGVKRWFYNSK